jgi:transcriptional regulator with XRE-family HTH domain
MGQQRRQSQAHKASKLLLSVGRTLKRLRIRKGVTLRQVAEGSALSVSFLKAVERGDSNIALGRLERLAAYFEIDLGTLLGATSQLSRPVFVRNEHRKLIKRGKGIHYESLRLPGLGIELDSMRLGAHTAFTRAVAHEGIDVAHVVEGGVVLVLAGVEYPMTAGDCCVFSAGFPHALRNDGAVPALVIGFTAGREL